MPPPPTPERGALLLADECFAIGDARFLECLGQIDSYKWLAAFAERWAKDPRPWARAQLLAYLEQPLAHPGHQTLVKRLFKAAEARGDEELMGAFLVAFDTLIRRVRRTRFRWDPRSRSGEQEDYLATALDVIRPAKAFYRDPRSGQLKEKKISARLPKNGRLFTYRTRHYLRRRVWRFFRHLGHRNSAGYPTAICQALRRYRDADFASGENILDSWALLHIAFHGCDALEFRATHHALKDGRALSELRAAPRFPAAWQTPAGARTLLELLRTARARLVRTWAIDLLRSAPLRNALEFEPDDLFALLGHEDEQVQQFAAGLFRDHPGLGKLPVETWLRLLRSGHATALATICEAFERHVNAARLTLAQTIEITLAAPVPVARLGLRLLQARAIAPAERSTLATLAEARCAALGGEITAWALARLGTAEAYQTEPVCRFFDSRHATMRLTAWAWLEAPEGAAGAADPILWSRLTETPFEDLRLRLIDRLARRADAPAPATDALAPVWCSVLLGVHRGGRQKPKATRQVAEAISREPARAAQLLPVLAVAVRSVRGPEARAGLAAVMTLLAGHPELADEVRRQLPELHFQPREVAA